MEILKNGQLLFMELIIQLIGLHRAIVYFKVSCKVEKKEKCSYQVEGRVIQVINAVGRNNL